MTESARAPRILSILALACFALIMGSDGASAHSGMVLLALDSGGGGNDLEPVNAYRDPAPAKRNNAMTFNGTTSYLTRATSGTTMAMSNQRLVICAWLKTDDSTRTSTIIHQDGNFYFNQSATTLSATVFWGPSGNPAPLTVTSQPGALVFGQWRHACFVVDPTVAAATQATFTLWIDGGINAQDTRVIGTSLLQGTNNALYLGGLPSPTGVSLAYKGWIDDTSWCRLAATDANLDAIANATTPVTTVCGATTVAWWKFDEIATGAPTTAPASGYIDPVNITGEAPYSRWMHVRGDSATLELRIDLDDDGAWDGVVTGNVWDERITWDKVGTFLFHVAFIDQFGRGQHNETTINILAPVASGLRLSPTDTTGGTPLTRLVTVEGDPRVVNIKVDYDGDGTTDAEVNNSTFGALHTWTSPGTYRLNAQVTNDANVTSYRESIITVQDDEAPTGTIYPEPGTRGLAPFTRWIVVRGDPTVRTIRIDATGDGTWDATTNARSHNFQHTWTTPGIVRLVVQLENEHGTNGTYDIPLRIENTLVQDPLTSDRTCGFCGFGDGASSWNDLDPTFTPGEVWDWLVFIALVAAAGFVLYFRIINGGT
ncbi:MAG: LamG-like jellyroll fold domain-containing protein [Candidatus Thermoplasmatota archaeon]